MEMIDIEEKADTHAESAMQFYSEFLTREQYAVRAKNSYMHGYNQAMLDFTIKRNKKIIARLRIKLIINWVEVICMIIITIWCITHFKTFL